MLAWLLAWGIFSPHLLPLCCFSWVGYEKEGYRGHQYLLEEGEYHDWRVWGGNNSELRSVRVIRAVGWRQEKHLREPQQADSVTHRRSQFSIGCCFS